MSSKSLGLARRLKTSTHVGIRDIGRSQTEKDGAVAPSLRSAGRASSGLPEVEAFAQECHAGLLDLPGLAERDPQTTCDLSVCEAFASDAVAPLDDSAFRLRQSGDAMSQVREVGRENGLLGDVDVAVGQVFDLEASRQVNDFSHDCSSR